jgi:hypothetical protein
VVEHDLAKPLGSKLSADEKALNTAILQALQELKRNI